MPVVVYFAPLLSREDGRGQLYFVSTRGQCDSMYEVYSSWVDSDYVWTWQYYGTPSRMIMPLPYLPYRYKVSMYLANDFGGVDEYVWGRPSSPRSWARYVLDDIDDPRDWWLSSRSRFLGLVDHEPMTVRARMMGLWRFYRHMAVLPADCE